MDCIHRNGDITGHIVQYGIQGSGSTVRKSVPGGAATEELEFTSALRCTFVSETQILLHVHHDDMCL